MPHGSGLKRDRIREKFRELRDALLNEKSVASGGENVNTRSAVTESPFEWGEAAGASRKRKTGERCRKLKIRNVEKGIRKVLRTRLRRMRSA